jgi:nitrogen regulatory protein P-II 2
MKLVIAIIRPEKLAAVQAALTEQEACLMSFSEVQGDGKERGRTGIYRGVESDLQWPKLRLEIAVDDWFIEEAVEVIIRAASTGASKQIGDCEVLVVQLDGYLTSAIAHEHWWPSDADREGPWEAR